MTELLFVLQTVNCLSILLFPSELLRTGISPRNTVPFKLGHDDRQQILVLALCILECVIDLKSFIPNTLKVGYWLANTIN